MERRQRRAALHFEFVRSFNDTTQSAGGSHHPSNEGKYIRVLVNAKGHATTFTTLESGAKKLQFPVGDADYTFRTYLPKS